MLKTLNGIIVLLLITLLPGCQVIGGIFKAGVWVGVLAVVLILGLIIYLVSRGSNKN